MREIPGIPYANDFEARVTSTEVIIDFLFRSGKKGRSVQVSQIVLSHEVAAKLGVALYPEDEEKEAENGS